MSSIRKVCNERFGDKWWVKLIGAPLLVAILLSFLFGVNKTIEGKLDKEEHGKEHAALHKLMDTRFEAILYQQNLMLDVFGVPKHKRAKKTVPER